MRAEEMREMAVEDIAARIKELEEERFRLQFRSATEPLEDPLRLRVIRKEIARLNTVQREKRTTGGAAAAGSGAKVKAAARPASATGAAKAKKRAAR